MNKKIPKSGYRVLAIVWTLASASMAVAFVRRLAEFNLFLLLLLTLSTLTAANFWKAYRRTPGEAPSQDPFDAPPKFSGRSVPFDDDPPPQGGQLFTGDGPNKDSEENDDER